MSFQATFSLVPSKRLKNCVRVWSLTLKCTNRFWGETVDIGLFPSDGSQPWYFRNIKFEAGQSYIFDYDTVNWEWYQNDYAAILGPGDKIIQKFQFRRKEYGPGECPECHGTHKCKGCNGQRYFYTLETGVIKCERCNGSGTCQTCLIPRRKPRLGGGPTGLEPF